MKKIDFPLFKTKSSKGSPVFDLNDPEERAKYFAFKAGPEIKKIQDYLARSTFLAILLAKKQAGKGTYSQMFREAVGTDQIAHVSVGDLVRGVDEELAEPKKKALLVDYLEKNYRGYIPLEQVIKAQERRSTQKLLPTEFVLALIKREIDRLGSKAIFLDGFPRDLDQVSYSLFFRDLVGHRDDPDFFVLINVPEAVIDQRIKYRLICPLCQTSRSLRLAPTSDVRYDQELDQFYLYCDNPECQKAPMVRKEGDDLGIKPIAARLKAEEELVGRALSLYGIPKILLRNSLPLAGADQWVDDYEITPEFIHSWDKKADRVMTTTKPWRIKDDQGRKSVSLLPAPVVVSFIKQLADLL